VREIEKNVTMTKEKCLYPLCSCDSDNRGCIYKQTKNNNMKLKALKRILDKMSENELNQNLLYLSDSLSISGVVVKVGKAKANLYYTGEDDPAELKTMKQLREEYDKEEIENFAIEIPKGAFVIKF
jgi:hypothetical protein